MRQQGVGSVEPDEGMASLERLMESELEQMGVVKTIGGDRGLVQFSEEMKFQGPGGKSGAAWPYGEERARIEESRKARPVAEVACRPADSLEEVEKTATAARRELLLVKDWIARSSREHWSS